MKSNRSRSSNSEEESEENQRDTKEKEPLTNEASKYTAEAQTILYLSQKKQQSARDVININKSLNEMKNTVLPPKPPPPPPPPPGIYLFLYIKILLDLR